MPPLHFKVRIPTLAISACTGKVTVWLLNYTLDLVVLV